MSTKPVAGSTTATVRREVSPSTDADAHRRQHTAYHRWREGVVAVLAIGIQLFSTVWRRSARVWMAAKLRADARYTGQGVHVYGPVRFLGTRNVTLGASGNLYDNVLFETVDEGRIEVGDGFRINRGTLISAHEEIRIGNKVLIGEYVSIRDNGHKFDDPRRPIGEQGFDVAPVRIGNDVWIGRGAVVLKGVTIGDGAVVAANAVVTRNVPPMEVWAGVPASLVRRRGECRTA